jgi:hypothetical protein
MEVNTVPYGPLLHPVTVRWEFLDQVPVWSTRDLEGKLLLFNEFNNWNRVYRGPEGSIPDSSAANTQVTTNRSTEAI